MVNTKYADAYKEVLIIINNLIEEDYKKIPESYIKFLENNCNKEYNFEYDKSIPISEQNLLQDTKYILFGLFEKFGATDVQKQKINDFRMNYNKKLEEQKREKYDTENIFKENNIVEQAYNSKQPEMIEIKDNLIKSFFKKIIRIFKGEF